MHKVLRQSSKLDHVRSILGNIALSSTESTIKIPPRKPRGPTDILEALSSTVGRDPTAAHYKYHDDPFLIPLSNLEKRTYALSQESGRKSARWIVNENRKLFKHRVAEPFIEFFAPKAIYTAKTKVDEEVLMKVINTGLVSDAITVYNLLQDKNIELSPEAKQALLEMVCFTNEEDSIPEELFEERWFDSTGHNYERLVKTWKDNGLAEKLFKEMSPAPPEAYSALIQGMAKFGQLEKAWDLFEQAREKNIQLDTGAYNAILNVLNGLREDQEMRWGLLQDLLQRMATEKLQPDINTLNSCLFTVSTMGGVNSVKYAARILAEFKEIGVHPSLGSYFLLFQLFARNKVAKVNVGRVLSDIVDRFEGQEIEIRHPLDTKFFAKAMEILRFNAPDPVLARRLDSLLHFKDNYNLIGDSYDENVYYRHYFILLCSTESMDSIMQLYDDLVPNVYTPEPAVIKELINTADLTGDINQFPRFWTDMVDFQIADRDGLCTQLLQALVRNEPQPGSPMVTTFADIASSIWERIENQPANRVNVIMWSGEMLSYVLILWSRSGNLELATKAMEKIATDRMYLGEPSIEALCSYMDLAVQHTDFEKAMTCLKFCKDSGRAEVTTMAADVRNRLQLTDEQAQRLAELVQ